MADKAQKTDKAGDKAAEVKDSAKKVSEDTASDAKAADAKTTDAKSKDKGAKTTDAKSKDKGAKDKDAKDKDAKGSEKARGKKKSQSEKAEKDEPKQKVHAPGAKRWPFPTMVTLLVVGVLWMAVFYIASTAGTDIPLISQLGYWNLAIGMGCLAGALVVATQWE